MLRLWHISVHGSLLSCMTGRHVLIVRMIRAPPLENRSTLHFKLTKMRIHCDHTRLVPDFDWLMFLLCACCASYLFIYLFFSLHVN